MPHTQYQVLCGHDDPSLLVKAAQLARRLNWPLTTQAPTAAIVLVVEPKHLALAVPEYPQFKPLYCDFAAGKQGYRLNHVHHEHLVKACRVKGLDRPLQIIDATAGLGRDALLLAAAGADIRLCEQQPALACLLEDLLTRIKDAAMPWSLRLYSMNASDYLCNLSEADRPDVIYLDPMFDHDASKTALVKKELQIIQRLVEPPSLAEQGALLAIARQQARYKVVVKRPRLGMALSGVKADYTLLGSHSRFDVYV